MTDPTNDRIRETTRRIVELLADGKFREIEALTRGVRLSANDMESAVRDYGRHLTVPPEAELARLDVIEVKGSKPRSWSVRVDLWTREEGRSDLSLELTLRDQPGPTLQVEVDNLHVL